ncbi:MAG: hypothetical protein ABI777_11450 [Betaproteobacteria bacterium]
MDTMSASDANIRFPRAAPMLPRPTHASTMVAAFYFMAVLAAPWIVRYAPDSDVRVFEWSAERPAVVRCAAAPEYGMPCGSRMPGITPPIQTSTRSIPPALARAT